MGSYMLVEIKFKGQRRALFINPREVPLKVGDFAVVEADKGEDLGRVNQFVAHPCTMLEDSDLKKIVRKPSKQDMLKYEKNRAEEESALQVCKEKVKKHGLKMNLIDCEFQFDKNKVTFYFTAENRVDFRELVKDLARVYRTRIELRQIGDRDASGRLGGYGVCGRPLCCTCWIRNFKPIPIQAAKDQHLPLSASQLAGLCGRLKCCLMYERDFYNQVVAQFPQLARPILTDRGEGIVQNIDVFHEKVVVKYPDDSLETYSLDYVKSKIHSCENVQEQASSEVNNLDCEPNQE